MLNVKGINFLYILLFAVAFAFTSCDEDQLQEDITPDTPTTEVQSQLSAALGQALPPSNSTASDSMCFSFNFPIEFVLEDGTIVSVADEDGLNDLFLDAEVSGNLVADFVYPLSLILQDGSETSVTGFEGLIEVLTDCYGDFEDWGDDEDWEDHEYCPGDFDFAGPCFDLVYPFTVLSGADQTPTEIIDEEAFAEFLISLDTTSLDAPFSFAFPFSVQLADSEEVVEINSEEDLTAVFEACVPTGGGFEGGFDDGFVFSDSLDCFTFVYPLQITFGEEPVTVNDEEAFIEAVAASEAFGFDFVYPLTVSLGATDTELTLASEADWEAVFLTCDFGGGGFDDGDGYDPNEGYGCFEIVFPFNLTINGELVTISSEEDFANVFTNVEQGEELNIELAYPITVTILSDSSTVVINSEEEWEALCDACHFDGGDGGFDDECYTLNFPLEVLVAGETVTVANVQALGELFSDINPQDFGGFAFPLSVTITDTGEVITINSEDEIAALAQYCN